MNYLSWYFNLKTGLFSLLVKLRMVQLTYHYVNIITTRFVILDSPILNYTKTWIVSSYNFRGTILLCQLPQNHRKTPLLHLFQWGSTETRPGRPLCRPETTLTLRQTYFLNHNCTNLKNFVGSYENFWCPKWSEKQPNLSIEGFDEFADNRVLMVGGTHRAVFF